MKLARITIENIRPSTPAGYPAKAISSRRNAITADIYREGHDVLAAIVKWRKKGDRSYTSSPMRAIGNDEWEATIVPESIGMHEFHIEAWTDHFATWQREAKIKFNAGQDISTEIWELIALLKGVPTSKKVRRTETISESILRLSSKSVSLEEKLNVALDPKLIEVVDEDPRKDDQTKSKTLLLWVDRERAQVGAWYEMFPRSEGGLANSIARLPAIADMGFDVVYLPPIHPIGQTKRKGINNTLVAKEGDPGSPWAIGSDEGGHTSIEPSIGTFDDFDLFIKEAEKHNLEVALDYALQCSPDHPWVKEHPEWFHHRPDGTIKHAENPPKKYEDIYPINLWTENGRAELWNACKAIFEFWIERGVKIFRVDNPHTKPFAYWEWVIDEIRTSFPDVIFLAEAFTRPKIMAKLAEIGFSQSYTYFTWRRAKWELTEYLLELTKSHKADYVRPNFWPNTPDILSAPLRYGDIGAFKQRLALAATMSPSYGIYSGYELGENLPQSEFNEEYLNSEKYEIRKRDWNDPQSLAGWIGKLNSVRRQHSALSELKNIQFHHSTNDWIIAYSKQTDDLQDVILVVVNLDPNNSQEATLYVDLASLGLADVDAFEAHDEITDTTFVWTSPEPYIRLEPSEPAHVLHLRHRSTTAVTAGVLPGVH